MKKSMVALLTGLLLLGVVVLTMGDAGQVEAFAQENNNLPDSSLLVDVTECESTESSATSDVTLEELQQKEDVAVGKYNNLLAQWAYDEEFIDDVNADFPEFYGGMYLDDDKNLVIQVTTLTDEVVDYFGGIIDLTDVEFEEVSYSFEELKEVHDDLENNMYSGEGYSWAEDISAVGVSLVDNCVTLYLVYPEQESYLVMHEQENYIKDVEFDISNCYNPDMVQVVTREMYDTTTGSSVYDVRLGTKMTSGGSSRSAGFWAYDSDGNKGIVTAGHNTSKGDVYTIVNTTFGTAGSPYIKGGVDAVFVKCSSSFLVCPDIFMMNQYVL